MQPKKSWNKPKLTIHGTVEELTQREKAFGGFDGDIFQGQQIGTVS
jgi:hypothetical protein